MTTKEQKQFSMNLRFQQEQKRANFLAARRQRISDEYSSLVKRPTNDFEESVIMIITVAEWTREKNK